MLAQQVATLANVPYSVTCHAFDIYRSDARTSALKQRLMGATFVRASHNALKASILELAPLANVVVISTPIDLATIAFREPPPLSDSLRILTVARLVPKKGVELLAPLHAELARRGIKNEITLIGPGDARIASGPGVTCTGPRSSTDVLDALRRADVFVLPARRTRDGDQDGLPIALLEAFAAGVPAVSTRVAGIVELFDGPLAQNLCPPDDVPALADAIERIVHDRAAVARAQRAAVERRQDRDGSALLHRFRGNVENTFSQAVP